MFCHECGAEVKNEGKFCGQCGARLSVTNNEETSAEQEKRAENSFKPIMKRREYFRTVEEKKIRKKVKALNILTGIMLVICGIGFVGGIISVMEIGDFLNETSTAFGEDPFSLIAIIGVVGSLAGCVVATILSVLILLFKHYGFGIPLFGSGMYPLMLCKGVIYKLFGGDVITATTSYNGHDISYYVESLQIAAQIVHAFLLGMFGVLIAMLVLSIQVTRNYNRYRKLN